MNSINFPPLPITAILPELKTRLASGTQLILQAPPGAGKTTLVPLALLEETWNRGQKILLLEPRRLAARAAALRMAELLGEAAGGTVGYTMRFEQQTSPRTRIEVITEGLLTRYLQADSSLQGVSAVIFDEFHERSLQADLGLALCLEIQEILRPELRLIVMSATLHSEAVAAIMPRAEVVSCPGKSYPVTTHFFQPGADSPERAVVRCILQALREHSGSILVFLPGAPEIRRTCRLLEVYPELPAGLLIAPLYGSLTWQQQKSAVAPAPAGVRKVVLATSLAETSLTIEGIRVVIDSGLMRVPGFDPGSGLNRLETITVTRDAADQRRGRAGRLGPGDCYRLWHEVTDQRLVPFRTPEILQADLSAFVLELALWGKRTAADLQLLDPPPPAVYEACRELLQELGALLPDGRITEQGRQMAALPVHPRLAHLLLETRGSAAGYTACLLASLLAEGDFLQTENPDLLLRLETLDRLARGGHAGLPSAVRFAGKRIIDGAARLARQLGLQPGALAYSRAGELLALAYPDRIARRKTPGVFQLVSGKQAAIAEELWEGMPEFLVAACLGGQQLRIFLAAPYSRELCGQQFACRLKEETIVQYLPEKKRVTARQRLVLGRLLLSESPLPDPARSLVTSALLAYIRQQGLQVLPWDKQSRSLLARMRFTADLAEIGTTWPRLADEELLANLETWLGPWLTGADLAVDLSAVLGGLLNHRQQQQLEQLAPSHLTVPSGSRLAVDYSDPRHPVLAVRLQEMFGLAETPAVGGGKVSLTLHLLSPAYRPVQITRDLANFWKCTYREVKKDLLGRYPKHYWPDDPLSAQATNRTKKGMQRSR